MIIIKNPKEGRDKTISDIDCNFKLVGNQLNSKFQPIKMPLIFTEPITSKTFYFTQMNNLINYFRLKNPHNII